MTGEHKGLVAERTEQALVDRANNGGEVTAGETSRSRASGKQCVTGKENGSAFYGEAHRARRVAGGGDSPYFEVADLQGNVVIEEEVIGRKHFGVSLGNGNFKARLSKGRDSLDVVMMPMGLDHRAHAESPSDL